MRISDWSSDVCSSDLIVQSLAVDGDGCGRRRVGYAVAGEFDPPRDDLLYRLVAVGQHEMEDAVQRRSPGGVEARRECIEKDRCGNRADEAAALPVARRRGDLGAAQAGGGGEIIVAPRPRLRLIAELVVGRGERRARILVIRLGKDQLRSEEHTSELQSLMRISDAVFCLKKQTNYKRNRDTTNTIISKTTSS